jgi:hypothetical protein
VPLKCLTTHDTRSVMWGQLTTKILRNVLVYWFYLRVRVLVPYISAVFRTTRSWFLLVVLPVVVPLLGYRVPVVPYKDSMYIGVLVYGLPVYIYIYMVQEIMVLTKRTKACNKLTLYKYTVSPIELSSVCFLPIFLLESAWNFGKATRNSC